MKNNLKKGADLHDFFVWCAKWSGLPYDLGQAPFSHTLEDVRKYSVNTTVKYDHENFGYYLARKIFNDLKDAGLDKGLVCMTMRSSETMCSLQSLFQGYFAVAGIGRCIPGQKSA